MELGEIKFSADVLDDVKIVYDRDKIIVKNLSKNIELSVQNKLSDDEYELIIKGGLLNKIKSQN